MGVRRRQVKRKVYFLSNRTLRTVKTHYKISYYELKIYIEYIEIFINNCYNIIKDTWKWPVINYMVFVIGLTEEKEEGGNTMKIAELLRDNGYKVTPQRLAVYDAINHNTTHPNAEAIYTKLQPQYPSMSLATVYKTMEIFAKIGVVKILQCGEDAHRYDYNTTQHAHIRCVQCNRVIDVDIDEKALAKQAAMQSGFAIEGVSLSFWGLCKDCEKALAAKKAAQAADEPQLEAGN